MSKSSTTKLPRCRGCGSRHRSWQRRVDCQFGPAIWITGDPPANGRCFASISDCRGQRTIELYATRAEAEQAKAVIDELACGGGCSRIHRIVEMRP